MTFLLGYERKQIFCLPTQGEFSKGGYRAVEPVAVSPLGDTPEMRRIFREAILRGNPVVRMLRRDEMPDDPVYLKYVGIKSYSAFERSATAWKVSNAGRSPGQGYVVMRMKRRAGWGWVPNDDDSVQLPPGLGDDALAEHIVAVIQQRSRE